VDNPVDRQPELAEKAERAAGEREAVQREWQRLQEAELMIAEAEARPLPPAGPGRAAHA
jgi:hypothetical protein